MIFGRQDENAQTASGGSAQSADSMAASGTTQTSDDTPVDLASIPGLDLSGGADNGGASPSSHAASYLEQLTAGAQNTPTHVNAPEPTVISPTPPVPDPAAVAGQPIDITTTSSTAQTTPQPSATTSHAEPMQLPEPESMPHTAPAPDPALANKSSISTSPINPDDLLALKQQALDQLTPLVGQLDQTPEERFRTTMMMIQSADNQSLIKDAYSAAQSISDDKIRAQALLDVINEINYFTQQQSDKQSGS